MEQIDDEMIKEVYALFGAAYYHSECLHRKLCHGYAILSFQHKKDITGPRVEEKLVRAYSFTLGRVLEEIKEIVPDDLYHRLLEGVEKRNFLAHHFWFEHIHLMFSIQGLQEMQQELSELMNLFMNLDSEVRFYFEPKMHALGLPYELLQQNMEEIMAGQPLDPLPNTRLPRKQERLIRAWDVPTPDGQITLIFESDDRALWQFCDVGLGWTRFDRIAPDWKPNGVLMQYLPAIITPRPVLQKPWDYSFELGKKAILWVKPGAKEKTFRWGVKQS